MPSYFLSLFTRWVHMLSMAALLGGALLMWWLAGGWQPWESEEEGRLLLFGARRYEWLFWISIGLLTLTGIGNLGAFGSDLPAGGSGWGIRFVVKLFLVLILIAFSLFRSLFVGGLWHNQNRIEPSGIVKVARALYAATTLLALAILLLAVFLAHG